MSVESRAGLTTERVRETLAAARRVVIKVGTRVLVSAGGRPDPGRLKSLVGELSALHQSGKEIVLVTSGAIGTGMEALQLKRRPKNLPDLQMCAAVGQSRLMSIYESLFQAQGITVGQVLLTYDDLQNRLRHLNARNTMRTMLSRRIIPVVNENDAVSVDEIRVGDNDILASLVGLLVDAEVLVLLSTTDGLRRDGARGKTERVPHIEAVTAKELDLVFGKQSDLSTGGMKSKLQAAQTLVRAGGLAVIADGRKSTTLARLFSGADEGTLIGKVDSVRAAGKPQRDRQRWLAFFQRAKGSIVVDDGARAAIENSGKSLLPIGVKRLEGSFSRGSVVSIRAVDGVLIAQGLVEFSSDELARIKGRRSGEIESVLGCKDVEEVVHRDNMVLLTK
jgi:glutamate 5-kinase